jgi:hypothetical protein
MTFPPFAASGDATTQRLFNRAGSIQAPFFSVRSSWQTISIQVISLPCR